MSGDQILQLFAYLLPAVVTGAVAFYFFRLHTRNEDGRRRFLLHKDSQKETLPIRLQAYERMALFLERIALNSLVVRVAPKGKIKATMKICLLNRLKQNSNIIYRNRSICPIRAGTSSKPLKMQRYKSSVPLE